MRNGTRWRSLLAILGLGLSVAATAQQPQQQKQTPQPPNQPQQQQQEIEPAAMAALDKMGAYLRTLKSFDIAATTSTDELLENGMKLQFDGTTRLQARRPDRLKMAIKSDRKERQIFYDGKRFTLYAPAVKFYASAAAPASIGETAQVLAKTYGIEMPLVDLFFWGTSEARPEEIKSALALGPATVDGTQTEHYFFRQEGVDWQVWIQKGAKPLPRKIVVTTTSEAAQPSHTMVLRWNLSPKFTDKLFAFTPPPDAMRIVLQTVDGKPALAAK